MKALLINASPRGAGSNTLLLAQAFLRGLEGATNLTARVTPVNSRSLAVRFRVDAFAAEVQPVRAACAG